MIKTKLRLKWIRKSSRKSYSKGYEQGYFDATIDYDLGKNKYKTNKGV